MARQPIKSEPGYTVDLEFCGYATKRFVLRFCGDFIGSFLTYGSAVVRAVGHNNIRKGATPIVEQPVAK